MRGHRRQFSQEFKRDAVRQVTEGGSSAAEVARQLGIRADQLRRWKRLVGGGSLGVVPSPRREELKRLRREIARLRGELVILERAARVLAENRLMIP